MDRTPQTKAPKSTGKMGSKVLSFRTDAAYFYERGVRYLERNDLKKALKAFRRTVEVEPHNPVNHCNLAGVLSELGDFEASNEVLLRILKEIDPSMSECQFYLANNYANMGLYETAEEYVLRYLDADPDGEYAEDAEEMLSVLMDEFGGGQAFHQWEARRKEQEQDLAKRDGRHLLEEGQFEAAVEWLENMIQQDPANTAAYNNLSLAYYYTGQHQQAIETAQKVLDRQPHNIHAMCNLTVFMVQQGPKDALVHMRERLSKVFPLHYDQAMKVGTTLGLVGDHEAAHNVFARLLRVVENPEPALIHSAAAAAANLGLFHEAKRWWKALSTLPEMADVAVYYIQLVDEAIREEKSRLRVSYQYDYPLHVQFANMKERLDDGNIAVWQSDPLLRASLYWGLRHGNLETKRAVLRTLALIADEDAKRAIRLFLKRRDIDSGLQAAALYALQRMGTRGRIEVFQDGELVTTRMSDVPKDVLMKVDPAYELVWEKAELALRRMHKSRFLNSAKRHWLGFLQYACFKNDVRILKPNVWAAALVYVILKEHDDAMAQKDVAALFKVSVSSLAKSAAKLAKEFEGPNVQ